MRKSSPQTLLPAPAPRLPPLPQRNLRSQTVDQRERPILEANRIANFLDSKSHIYRRTRERLHNKLGEKLMRAQGKLGTRATSFWE